jgi:FdhE protein
MIDRAARAPAFSFGRRIERAAELAAKLDYARQVLDFYREVAGFQGRLYEGLSRQLDPAEIPWGEGRPIHHGLLERQLPVLLAEFPGLLLLVRRAGPELLARAADELLTEFSPDDWAALLRDYWRAATEPDAAPPPEPDVTDFFPKAFLQPYAEFLAAHCPFLPPDDEMDWRVAAGRARCPVCGARPQVSVLRPESHGAKRYLTCALCGFEWRYKRVCCPACGEEDFNKLAYHKPPDFELPHVRVEVCETCRGYIKSVDLTEYGLAVPVVDELAALALDVWAVEQGYRKVEPNLAGI